MPSWLTHWFSDLWQAVGARSALCLQHQEGPACYKTATRKKFVEILNESEPAVLEKGHLGVGGPFCFPKYSALDRESEIIRFTLER